jgi:lysophospholipase L1-like esterase
MTKLTSTLAGIGTLTLALLALRCSSGGSTPSADAGASDAGASDAGASDAGEGDADAAAGAQPTGCTFDPGFDGGKRTFGPFDPNIQIVGRVDLTQPSKRPRFSASAASITAKFMGDSVAVRLFDENRGGSFNLFEAVVDNYPPVELIAANIDQAQTQVVFPVNVVDDAGAPAALPCGTHTITVVKRTEADTGWTEFGGFDFAEILPPDPILTRKIEIIGDSITCGAGVEANGVSAGSCSSNGFVDSKGNPVAGYGQGVENGYVAYGPVLARQLNAAWHVTCASGIGLVRSYWSRGDQTPMPGIYPFLFPEDEMTNKAPWPTTQWATQGDASLSGTPDVIVIGLGTNDFSRDGPPGPDGGTQLRDPMPVGSVLDAGLDAASDAGETLEQGYVQFIDQLKGYFQGVHVVLISSPILGDMYPTPTDMQLTQHAQAIQDVSAYYANDPNVHVDFVVLPKVLGTGCGGHPGVAQQASAATAIATKIKSIMSW